MWRCIRSRLTAIAPLLVGLSSLVRNTVNASLCDACQYRSAGRYNIVDFEVGKYGLLVSTDSTAWSTR